MLYGLPPVKNESMPPSVYIETTMLGYFVSRGIETPVICTPEELLEF